MSTGAFVDSGFKPGCSFNASKKVVPIGSGCNFEFGLDSGAKFHVEIERPAELGRESAFAQRNGSRGPVTSLCEGCALLSLHAQTQSVECQIDYRCCVQRQQLTQEKASHDCDAKRSAELISRPRSQSQWQSA